MEKEFFVYLLASGFNGTLYVGVTSDLAKRIYQHKEGKTESFTRKYRVKSLVWFKQCDSAESSIKLEKRLKKYKREWKINLIEQENPHWEDLYESICK